MQAQKNAMHSTMPNYTVEMRRTNILLNLVNFRIHDNVEISLPLNSVTLINGPSGVGKTSILEAFIFVMYNAVQNPEKFDTKRCWGWLFIGDLIIYRQKDPNLLKVWRSSISPGGPFQNPKEYTNDDAQLVIDEIYGTKDTFLGCSYLRQKEFSVFLSGSDADKLELMKTIAMKGSELDETKGPIKQKLTSLKEEFISLRAQFEMALNNIQAFDVKHPNLVKYNLPTNTTDIMAKVMELRTVIAGMEQNYENAVKVEASVNYVNAQLSNYTSAKSMIEERLRNIDSLSQRKRLEELESKIKEIDGSSPDSTRLAKAQLFKAWTQDVSHLELKLAESEKEYEGFLASVKKLAPDFPAYVTYGPDPFTISPERTASENQIVQYISIWKVRFEHMQETLKQISYTLARENHKDLNSANIALKAMDDEIEQLKKKEKVIRGELDKKRQMNKMKCPTCSASLVMSNDGKSLEKSLDVAQGLGAMLGGPEKPVEVITATNEDLMNVISSTSSLNSKREQLSNTIKLIERMKYDIGSFTVESASACLPLFSKYQSLKLALDNLREMLKNKKDNKPEEVTEKFSDPKEKEAFETERVKVKKTIDDYDRLLKDLNQTEANIQAAHNYMGELSKNVTSSSAEIKRNKLSLQEQIDQLMHFSSANELLTQRSILENIMTEKRRETETVEARMNACDRLYSKAIEAERICLEGAVSEINSHLSMILKRLFTTIPISVSLNTTKSLKSKKKGGVGVSQRFDIQIHYNNAEYGSAKQLSGGEKDRLSLAITLAMSKKFGGSIIFLDETLSSLDSELKGEAVTLLREFTSEKTIVCISHEETEGLYDYVVRIKSPNTN